VIRARQLRIMTPLLEGVLSRVTRSNDGRLRSDIQNTLAPPVSNHLYAIGSDLRRVGHHGGRLRQPAGNASASAPASGGRLS
jgi:hypothetical protein